MTKAPTEEPRGSPPMVAAASMKRFSTPDHGPNIRMMPRLLVKVPTIEEEDPRGESPEASGAVVPPRRSSSSIGQVRITRKLSDGGEGEESSHSDLMVPGSMSSPGATSLPPEMLFDAIQESGDSGEHENPQENSTASDSGKQTTESKTADSAEKEVGVSPSGSGQDKVGVAGDDSVIVNLHAKSTSPEPVPETTSDGANLLNSKDKTKPGTVTTTSTRGGKVVATEEALVKDGGKGQSKGKEGSKWFSWRSQTLDRKRAKSVHGTKSAVAPGDLILTNEAFATSDPKTKSKHGKKLLSRSDSDTSSLNSKVEGIKEAKSTRSVENEVVHSSPLHRSLSDSNIPILIRVETPGASPLLTSRTTNTLDNSNLRASRSLRRVVSSGTVPPRSRDRPARESMHDKVLENVFSASIIPHSLDSMQKMTSPARHLPLARTNKLQRSITVDEESFNEANKGGLPSAEDNERNAASKSPPMLVLSPTSPVQSSVLSSPSPQGVGWTPVVAAVIWCRMLRILGDINDIQDPVIHAEAMGCLQDTWKALSNVSLYA